MNLIQIHSALWLILLLLGGCSSPISQSPSQSYTSAHHSADESVGQPTSQPTHQPTRQPARQVEGRVESSKSSGSLIPQQQHRLQSGRGVAVFAGGCFWCVEDAFDDFKGVTAALSGYTGGSEKSPTYAQVSAGRTAHLEAVLVIYDPKVVSYDALIDRFWRTINPTQADGQFADRGMQYQTAIFYVDEAQARIARESKKKLGSSGRFSDPIVTPIRPAEPFWVAEEYHQDYARKNPAHYKKYKWGSGRGGYLKRVWDTSP